MTFFYDLNNRLSQLADKQDAKQLAESKQAKTVEQSLLTQALNEGQAKRLPGLPITNKDVEKKFGGSMIKMAQAAKDAGFSDARIAQAMDDLKQGKNPNDVAEADYSAKKAAAGKDIGKPGKNFNKIAKSAGAKYGSKAAGERVAGAVLNKLRHPKEDIEQEGNAFTGALAKTPKGQNFALGGKKFKDTSSIEEVGMTPKQQKFAKLAPPVDKITFADKIAGAKKEVDEMLGDVAADAMRKAITSRGGEVSKTSKGITHRSTNAYGGTKDEPADNLGKLNKSRTAGLEKGMGVKFAKKNREVDPELEVDEGFADMDAWLASREKEKGTGRYDKRKVSTGTVYTRKPETFASDDDEEVSTEPKRRGRPKGKDKGPERVTAKSYKYKAGRPAKVKEGNNCCPHCGESLEVDEVAPPGAKAERMVKGIKKSLSKDGKLSAKDKAIAYATTWKAKKAGKVEEAGKPDFLDLDKDGNKTEPMKKAAKDKAEKKVDETTVSGSVATAPAAPKAGKGMQFGKGVYEGFNSKVENMITEGMSINISVDEQGKKSISVNATEGDAEALAQLLKMAGLGGGESKQEVCPGCGSADCGCDAEVVDENSPDWPTNTETIDADPELRTYSGGLNGPKSTGQTTVPVVASQLRRQASMEENIELERNLFKTWKNYKG